MKTETITIANLKCEGCENTIQKKLSAIKGVQHVSVNNDADTVTIEHDDQSERTQFTKTLASLGYPEATEENGLLMQLKSYASCAVGRMSK